MVQRKLIKNGKQISLLLTILIVISPITAASPSVFKVGATSEVFAESGQKVNATFYLDGEKVYKNETLSHKHTWFYTPNESQIGYHNLTMIIENENGTSVKQFEIFVGTLFAIKNESVGSINATVESILAEPNSHYELKIFVENSIGVFRTMTGEINNVNFTGSRSIFNLTTFSRDDIIYSAPIPVANGTIYTLPFNTSNKSGTFILALHKPYAITPAGDKINVIVVPGQVKVAPIYDIDANGVVNIIENAIINQNMEKTGDEMCPDYSKRCDTDKSGRVDIRDFFPVLGHFNETIKNDY